MATEVVHTIALTGGDYTSLAAWEAAQQRDLVTADEIAVAEIDGDFDASYPHLDISGWTHDATHYCLIRAKPATEFNVVTRTGSKLNDSGSTAYGFVFRAGHRLYIESLGIYFVNNTHSLNYIGGDYGNISKCFIDVVYGNTLSPTDVVDSLYECSHLSSTYYAGNPQNTTLKNVTIIGKSGTGAFNGDIIVHSCTCTNVVAYNGNTKSSYNTYYNCTGDYNAQNDNGSAAPPGANSITGITTSDFVDYTGGDYHLSPTSSLIGAGTNLYSSFTTDIDGDTWPASGAWDIGFDYYVSSSAGITVTPSKGIITVTGYSPSVSVSNNIVVTPGVGTMSMSGYAPVILVSDNQAVSPSTGSVTVTGYAPSISITTGTGITVTPSAGAITLTGHAPAIAVSDKVQVNPSTGTVTTTGYSPIVQISDNVTVSPSKGTVTFTGFAPSISTIASIGGDTNIGEYFTSGSTVTITLYNPVTGDVIPLNSSSCKEIGSTGLFIWDTSNITTQPTSYQEYAWKMTDGTNSEGGIKILNPINVDENNFLIQYLIHNEMFN